MEITQEMWDALLERVVALEETVYTNKKVDDSEEETEEE